MRSSLKFFLPGFFLLFLVQGNAQVLTITKDYNACLYGLTDKPGHWVVPAKYLYMGKFESGFSIVMAESKYGLINSSGVEVIPLIYDELRGFNNVNQTYELNRNDMTVNATSSVLPDQRLYYARKKKLVGILDASGKEVVPVQYLSLNDYFTNGVCVFSSAAGKGFLDLDGVRGMMPQEFFTQVHPSGYRYGLYIVSKTECAGNHLNCKTKYGVYNDSARLIVPCEYDSVNFYSGFRDIIEVYKNGKTGYYTGSGKKLFDAIYFIKGARERKASPLVVDGRTLAFDGKYWGILKIDGTYALDFKYDQLVPLYDRYNPNTPIPEYKIKENGKWGIISWDGQWILPAQWTDVANDLWLVGVNPAEYIFNVKKDDHWGAISSSGQEIMPFVYDTLFNLDRGVIYWSEEQTDFLSYKSAAGAILIYDYDPVKDSANPRYKHWKDGPHPYSYNDDMPAFYTDFDDYYNRDENNKHYRYGKYLDEVDQPSVSYVLKQETKDPGYSFYVYTSHSGTHWDNANGSYPTEDNPPQQVDVEMLVHHTKNNFLSVTYLTPLTSDSTFIYYSFEQTGIIRSDGKIIIQPGRFKKVFPGAPGYFTITNSNGSLKGLVNLEGKLVVDTVWKAIASLGTDTVWVKENNKNATDCNGEWNVMLLKTGQKLWAKEDQLTSMNNKQPVATSKGVGLFNRKTMSFVLPPVYKSIYPSFYLYDTYVVENCSGKIGIVNGNGTWATDSCWTSVFRATSWEQLGRDSATGQPTTMYREKLVLLNDTGWILYDNTGIVERGNAALALRVFSLAQQESKLLDCSDCPYLAGDKLPALASWQSELLFNALYRSSSTLALSQKFNAAQSPCPCHSMVRVKPGNMYERNSSNKNNVKHTLTFQTDSCFVFESFRPTGYYNYLLFADGPRIQTLDSLFTGEKWRTVITNETMNFLNAHPGINANCSNPAMYSRIFNESFLLAPTGIVFYPDWQTSGFLIPWSLLRPYLKQDIANKLNLD